MIHNWLGVFRSHFLLVILSFQALQMIEDVSCIRFKSQHEVQHKDHIEFLTGRGCYSQVGRSGNGKQEIVLRQECAKVGTHLILHEVSINLRPSIKIEASIIISDLRCTTRM